MEQNNKDLVVINKDKVVEQLVSCFPNLKHATLAERNMALSFCLKHNLNPILKEVHIVPMGGKLAPVVNYLILVNRVREKYPTLQEKWEYYWQAEPYKSKLVAVNLTLAINGHNLASQIVSFSEYTTGKNLWNSKPITMLLKVARAQAFRLIDIEFSAMYIAEELELSEAKVIKKDNFNLNSYKDADIERALELEAQKQGVNND